MTAKPTQNEKDEIPHHLYDLIEINQIDFNVNKYMDMALQAIQEI